MAHAEKQLVWSRARADAISSTDPTFAARSTSIREGRSVCARLTDDEHAERDRRRWRESKARAKLKRLSSSGTDRA